MIDREERIWRIDQQHHVVSGQGLLDVIGLLIDLDATIRADTTWEGMPVNILEKADRDRPDQAREAGCRKVAKATRGG